MIMTGKPKTSEMKKERRQLKENTFELLCFAETHRRISCL